jgi:hypothetical protein
MLYGNESQETAILKHLQSGKAITPVEALNFFGCFRLGARIFNLKKRGFVIETRMEEKAGKKFAKYSMPTS